MLLSIITVSYNTKDLTIQTFESAYKDIKNSNLDKKTEFIVIDNNSQDESVKAIKNFFTKNKINHLVIENKDNPGFAKANNQGIKKSKGRYILLLNPDTITKAGAIKKLIDVFENNPIDNTTAYMPSENKLRDRLGIISPTLLNLDGSIQPQGGSNPTLFSIAVHMLFLTNLPFIGKFLPSTQHTGKNKNSLRKKYWLCAAALLIRKKVIDEIGLLDQNIFMYGEDVEFCMRAQHHHWDIAILPNAFITHLGSASSSSRNAVLGEFKGYVYIWAKHKPLWQTPILKLILKIGAVLRVLVFDTILPDANRKETYKQAFKLV